MVLSILFSITLFSLFGGDDQAEKVAQNTVHIVAGSLMLIGSAVHLGTNWDWVKAVFSRPANSFKKRLRQNRHTDLGLFISGLICAFTGILWLLLLGANPNILERWYNLHTMSGIFMIVLLGIHLLLHWGWMVNTARQLRSHQPPKGDEQITASSEA
jgi:hypothetical protein